MTKNDIDLIYTPWEDDEIEFQKGDWQIRRDECFGLYRYTVSGIECQEPVDAVQLLAWRMAKICDYPCMHPWERSDITFTGEIVIIRDPTDKTGTICKRDYLFSIGDKVCRANKYYLLRSGYAKCGEKTVKEIEKVKISPSPESWYSDDIVFTPKKNVSVGRAISPGTYKIVINGIRSVRNADYLIKNGLAVKVFDAKFDKLVKCKMTSVDELRKATCNFWLSPNADEIKTIREIAKTYDAVEKGGTQLIKKRVGAILPDIDAELEGLKDVQNAIEQIEIEGKNVDKQSKDCLTKYNSALTVYRAKKVTDEFSPKLFNDTYQSIINCYDSAIASLKKIEDLRNFLDSKEEKYSSICQKTEDAMNIDASVFPKSIQQMVGESVEKGNEFKKLVEDILNEISACKKKKYDKNNKSLDDCKQGVEGLKKDIEKLFDRQCRLNALYKMLGSDKNKSKFYLINRTYKPDKIKFVTALKVKHVGGGKYVIEGTKAVEKIVLYADDLVYLKLAKRI